MTSITRGQFQSTSNASYFLYHRVSRIYPTYWLYSAFVLIIFMIRPEWVNSAQGNQVNILSSFLLWPENTLPLINVGWTLIHEMYFYLVFFVLLVFISEEKLGFSLLLWGVIVVVANFYLATNNPVLSLVTNPLTLEFIAGCFLAIHFRKDRGWSFTLLLIISSIIVVLILTALSKSEIPNDWWRVGIYGIPATAVLYCLVVAERENFILNKYLSRLGDASYSIYLVHVLVLSAAGRAFYVLSKSYPISNATMIAALCFSVVASSLISYRIIERPLLKASLKLYHFSKLNKSSKKNAQKPASF